MRQMAIVAFPNPLLTRADEAAIAARIAGQTYYRCVREFDDGRRPALTLIDGKGDLRGRVTKNHGVFSVLDARGKVVMSSRNLDEVLAVLSK